MSALSRLLEKYPDLPIREVRHELDAEGFEKYRQKHEEYPFEGGAVGVIWVSEEEVVLTKRSQSLAGWALPGGRVDRGEDFDAGLIREVKEETDLNVTEVTAVVVEEKLMVSPGGIEIPLTLVLFEGYALGQEACETEESRSEGLEIAVFNVNDLPEMIFTDRAKVEMCIERRAV
jgi:ADP-ribose pyrophosphatase YjhB (NUDIX family)